MPFRVTKPSTSPLAVDENCFCQIFVSYWDSLSLNFNEGGRDRRSSFLQFFGT
jgi:hypothetical protein